MAYDVTTLPGVKELWALTKGDPSLAIAVLDGNVDLGHASLAGAELELQVGRCDADEPVEGLMPTHGTHVTSVIFGQPGTNVEGLAPRCRGVIIPVFCEKRRRLSQMDLTRAIEQAVSSGCRIVSLSGGQLADVPNAEDLLEKAVRLCQERDVLLIAAAGNDGCQCLHVPASLPNVLAVGAHDEHGQPMDFSNWGETYRLQGILAPGENIRGAQPGGGTVELSGTSFATPVVSGVAALLMSLQSKLGLPVSASQVRKALLSSADPCECSDQGRCLAGKLNVTGAMKYIMASEIAAITPSGCGCSDPPPSEQKPAAAEAVAPSSFTGLVYALGAVGYDFGTEARRDSFKQLMPPVTIDTHRVPANPHDARQMVDYLDRNLAEAKALIWTLNLELTPVYALEPVGPFAREVYSALHHLMGGQIAAETTDEYVARCSVPGRLAGRTVRLFSGQYVPVVEIDNVRGLYGWHLNRLVAAAVEAVKIHKSKLDEPAVQHILNNFLSRIYFDLRNLGTSSHDRAMNFAATNAFQAAHTIADAVARGMDLDSVEVERSAFCRMDSDCWDVKLKFFDPENSRRAKRVYRFTIDVSDTLPVTTGEVRTWSSAD